MLAKNPIKQKHRVDITIAVEGDIKHKSNK